MTSPTQQKTMEEKVDEFINKLLSRAEIPEFAKDIRQPIKSFIKQEILTTIEQIEAELPEEKKMESHRCPDALCPHYPRTDTHNTLLSKVKQILNKHRI